MKQIVATRGSSSIKISSGNSTRDKLMNEVIGNSANPLATAQTIQARLSGQGIASEISGLPTAPPAAPAVTPQQEAPNMYFASMGSAVNVPSTLGSIASIAGSVSSIINAFQVPGSGFPDVRSVEASMPTVNTGPLLQLPAGLPVPPMDATGAAAGQLTTAGRKRSRRMNMTNPKALTRAVRRLAGFQAFATKAEKELVKLVRKAGGMPRQRQKARVVSSQRLLPAVNVIDTD